MIIAIDPGTFESALATYDGVKPLWFDILDNFTVLQMFRDAHPVLQGATHCVIEKIVSYGNAMGQTTIDTAMWTGVFMACCDEHVCKATLMRRKEVGKHLCLNGNAKDSNITQALADRFAYGIRNKGKGVIKEPGYFYGFRDDIWQAFALGVTYWDQNFKE